MLRYKSAWMPVAGTAEDQMQSYSRESQLVRRELAAGARGLGPGLGPVGGGALRATHRRHVY